MNEIVCEMCGSNNVIKQDDFYVCQSCNTKYTPEEFEKLIDGATIEIKGPVKIDQTSELSNLYKLARRAKEINNATDALKYYNQILKMDPDSWEAQFYVLYFKAISSPIMDISSESVIFANFIPSIFSMVNNHVSKDKQNEVIIEIAEKTIDLSLMLFHTTKDNRFRIFEGNVENANKITKDTTIDGEKINVYKYENHYLLAYVNNISSIKAILYTLGDNLISLYGDTYKDLAVKSWKEGIIMHKAYIKYIWLNKDSEEIIKSYADKIKNYEPDYKIPRNWGCYIATCVYGSYDCPEVWTLRRFRDNTLDKHLFGKIFIKTYYATSPTIVKYFGKYPLFNKIFKTILDKIVNKLQKEGVDSTFYLD